ncbi:MAG: L,D-transpeptidase [Clostridium perfringens]|nr:L,D-transpeptidase [Clostridium perfringens]
MFKNRKVKLYILVILGITTLYLGTCFFIYKNNLNKFKESIYSEGYIQAKSILSNKGLNIISLLNLDKQTSKILNQHLNELNNDYLLDSISQEDLLLKLNSLEFLDLNSNQVSTFKENLPLISSSNETYLNAISLFNTQNYEEALDEFNNVNPLNSNYKSALEYKKKCVDILKPTIISTVNELVEKNSYSEAINILDEYIDKFNYNIELINKLTEVKELRMNYLEEFSENSLTTNEYSAQTMSSYYNKLDPTTINTFDISSNTNKLVFVNISEQKTYIYTGSINNWSLEKEFVCSTGIENKETPVGIFEVQTRAPWFFASKYGQGGKYYVQFMGNYLFHSIPFAEDQETILDETLGEPASHGCIRLDTNNAKWLYDNVLDGSKIIIY